MTDSLEVAAIVVGMFFAVFLACLWLGFYLTREETDATTR
jgi:hypothetical protein